MEIINYRTVKVYTFLELKDVLEGSNGFEYIYIVNNIVIEGNVVINKKKVIIDGIYNNIRYKLSGMNSCEDSDTFVVDSGDKEIEFRNVDVVYTNTYGLVNVIEKNKIYNVLVIFNNVYFMGTKLVINPYGSVKITDCIIKMMEINSVLPQEVCYIKNVIIGGSSNITCENCSGPVFLFRSDTIGPSIIFLCKCNVVITSDTNAFMNGSNRVNFTLLHDSYVNIITCNGFAGYTIHGANNVLIEQRAKLVFIENDHKRIPMWSVFGSFTMKKDSSLEVINSYNKTPSDNYNIHFKGQRCKLILDDPKCVKFYTKNANVLYSNNEMEFEIKCSRFNFWINAKDIDVAGDINDLPDYYWFKDDGLFEVAGTISSGDTVVLSHNLIDGVGCDISNFSFQSKKCFSIGNNFINVHPINDSINKICGHTISNGSVIIKFNDVKDIVYSDSSGYFEYNCSSIISDGTDVEIISNDPNGFIFGSRIVNSPYAGELSIMEISEVFDFSLIPLESSIFPRNKSFIIKVIDSRVVKDSWSLVAYLLEDFSSQLGFCLNDALIFKKFDNEIVILSNEEKVIYNSSDGGDVNVIEWSNDRGLLLDLSNSYMEINEEYFASIVFKLRG